MPVDSLPEPLDRLWNDVHDAVEGACKANGRLASVAEQIVRLRLSYKNEYRDGAPQFTDPDTCLAYAVAYHPAHAFVYLHLLLRRSLGGVIFGKVSASPKVLVLGAGLGAETLAVVRWMEVEAPHLLKQAHFVLVDRADWARTRCSVLDPTLRELQKKHEIVIDHFTVDLSTACGEQFLASEASLADVVFCPSVISEMIADGTESAFLTLLHRYLSDSAHLVLIDHLDDDFEQVARKWSQRFKILLDGKSGGIIFPRPSEWVRAHLLDGADHRIPTGSYPFAWFVLAR